MDIINQAYYKHWAASYDERYVEDICRQYRMLFSALDLRGRFDLTVVDVGGGTGFTYDQFVSNAITWKNYFFIEPDQEMVIQFKTSRRPDTETVKICLGRFEEFVDKLKHFQNKLVIFSSCLHHIIWIDQILDHAKRCMKPGDLLLFCHEPNNTYFLSPLMLVNYILRFITTDIIPRKLGVWKSVAERLRIEKWHNINQDLISRGMVKVSLSPLMLRRIVDYGVGLSGDWKLLNIPKKYDEGHWTPKELTDYLGPSFKTLYFRSYRHLGDPGTNRLIGVINRLLEQLFINWGSVFCLALLKQEPDR